MPPLKIALVGAGLIGQDHIALIQNSPHSQLAGICDVSQAAAQIAANEETHFYQDVDTLIRRENPDGVIIASPNGFHAEHAQICAAHHVPVLIEKPIAGTLEDAYRIENLAEKQGAFILIGHYRRHNPLVAKAKSLLDAGVIGRPIGVSVIWSLLKPNEYFEETWRIERPNGGPALINLIHDIDNLRFMLGEIASVFAHKSHKARQFDVEDTLSISLEFENGVLGTVLVSDSALSPWAYEATTKERNYFGHSDENCYYFIGSAGAFAFPQLDIWRYPSQSPGNWRHSLERTTEVVGRHNPMQAQFDHFLRVIQKVEQPFVTATDGLHSLAAVLAILRSAERQRPIAIQDLLGRPMP